MYAWWLHLDELLRGRRTTPEALARGELKIPLAVALGLAIVLGAVYGFFMGWFGLLNRTPRDVMFVFASMVKLPALFLLTLIVTFPSLYVFNSLMGCRLTLLATLKLLLSAIVVNLVVAASLGTILGFFTLSTTSYSFMVVLNVALLGVAGAVGLGFLLRALQQLALWQAGAVPAAAVEIVEPRSNAQAGLNPHESPPRADDLLGPAHAVFRIWVVIYALVGTQMAWLLRPFIGSPQQPFTWLRPRSGNFYEALWSAIETLLQAR